MCARQALAEVGESPGRRMDAPGCRREVCRECQGENQSKKDQAMKQVIQLIRAFLLVSSAASHSAEAAAKPVRVFILAKDLGVWSEDCDHAPANLVRTPNSDRLARECRRFTDTNTLASVCPPTRDAVLTDRYCWRTPSATTATPSWPGRLPQRNPVVRPDRSCILLLRLPRLPPLATLAHRWRRRPRHRRSSCAAFGRTI